MGYTQLPILFSSVFLVLSYICLYYFKIEPKLIAFPVKFFSLLHVQLFQC